MFSEIMGILSNLLHFCIGSVALFKLSFVITFLNLLPYAS